MSERYSRLFALSAPIYAVGAPVVITAGALLKDNQTGKVLAQLKIQNISHKAIKAATVKLEPLDTIGEPLGKPVEFQYLDLNVARDMEFGQKTPIVLPDAATRGFRVSVSDAFFVDNTAWTSSGAPWEPLPAPVTLEQALVEKELVKQYQMEYGDNCKFMFCDEKDLWWCPCGILNHKSEPYCHKCRKEATVLAALDIDKLKTDCQKRLEVMQQKAKEEKAVKAAQTKKNRKIVMIAAPIAVIAIAACILIFSYFSKVQKSNDYHAGLAALEAENYSEAVELFEGLGDYEDSEELLKEAQTQKSNAETYAEAVECMKPGTYGRAAFLFGELGSYKDSRAQFAIAVEMSEKDDLYQETIDILDRLNEDLGYQDAGDTYKTPADEEYYELSSQAYNNLASLSGYRDTDQLLERFRKMIIGRRGAEISYYRYDNEGRLTQKDSASYSYNPDGILTGFEVSLPTSIDIYKVTDYDSDGRPLRAEQTDLEEWEQYAAYTYTYDANGRLVKKEYRSKSADADWVSETWIDYVYDYDEDGRLIKETRTFEMLDAPRVTVTTYGYEEDGAVLLDGEQMFLVNWVYMP